MNSLREDPELGTQNKALEIRKQIILCAAAQGFVDQSYALVAGLTDEKIRARNYRLLAMVFKKNSIDAGRAIELAEMNEDSEERRAHKSEKPETKDLETIESFQEYSEENRPLRNAFDLAKNAIANRPVSSDDFSRVYFQIACSEAEAGFIDDALETVKRISIQRQASHIYKVITEALIKKGEIEQAKKIAKNVTDLNDSLEVQVMFNSLPGEGTRAQEEKLISIWKTAVANLPEDEDLIFFIHQLFSEFVSIGAFESALGVIDDLKVQGWQSFVHEYAEIADELMKLDRDPSAMVELAQSNIDSLSQERDVIGELTRYSVEGVIQALPKFAGILFNKYKAAVDSLDQQKATAMLTSAIDNDDKDLIKALGIVLPAELRRGIIANIKEVRDDVESVQGLFMSEPSR